MTPLHIALSVALFALAGCASWDDHVSRITLQHVPHQMPVDAAATTSGVIQVTVDDQRDYLAPGISRKWGRAVVGYGRNGLGEQTYPTIVVTEPVADTFREAIATELRARGFQVTEASALRVSVDLLVFFNDYQVGVFVSDAQAQLDFRVKLIDAGRVRFERQFSVEGRRRWVDTLGSRDAEAALNLALDKAMEALLGDPQFIDVLQAMR